ncbi:hypothetical protein PJK54_06415 [Cobetia sp. MMG027]|nr:MULTISPECIES: hypothetical protein [unclassified Cobetia]MDA5563297.1 hypothetical protein [Cobetia sp. MMG027]
MVRLIAWPDGVMKAGDLPWRIPQHCSNHANFQTIDFIGFFKEVVVE